MCHFDYDRDYVLFILAYTANQFRTSGVCEYYYSHTVNFGNGFILDTNGGEVGETFIPYFQLNE